VAPGELNFLPPNTGGGAKNPRVPTYYDSYKVIGMSSGGCHCARGDGRG